MNKETKTPMGFNRTGTKMSPHDFEKLKSGTEELTQASEGDGSLIADIRIRYMKEADPVGSIPVPTTLKGIASSFQEKMLNGSHAFVDKLGERLAFERSGTRLYEALLSKYNGSGHQQILPELTRLEQFYLEELKHFQIVSEVITKIGADPTAITPAANISSTASQGWIQVITDPRTNFLQSLEIILQAELIDNAGWELLIELAEKTGLSEIAVDFQQCLDEEAFHLITVKQWVQELTLENGIISPEENLLFEPVVGLKH